jgi:S1-C subfamily serine protease
MIRKALLSASLLVVGLSLGWLCQGLSLTRAANAKQQPSNSAFTNVSPQNAVAPTQPIVFADGFIPMTSEEAVNVSVYEKTNRSVVNISTNSVRPESMFLMSEVEGSGSGSVIDKLGHILTNNHVIDGAKQITVMLYNTESFPAELVGQDRDNDIAVLKIIAPENLLFPVPWGESSSLRVGQHIIAIGNPFGLERTMSTGIISSLNRELPVKEDSNRRDPNKRSHVIRSIIQIDAALNQGNSGGPLLNSRGELIGMNTAIATRSGDNAGIGFAIPINSIRRVVPQLIAHGKIQRPTIGIMQVFETDRGLLVVNLTPNGPAEKAGLRGSRIERKKVRRGVLTFEHEGIDHSQSDLIVGIDGQRIKNSDDLLSAIEARKAGDQITLYVTRDGQTVQLPVTLGASE